MIPKRAVGLAMLVLLVAALAPCAAQSISGTITTAGGGGLTGVTVTARGADYGFIFTATTDASGNYSISLQQDDAYTVTPTLTGYNFGPVNQWVTATVSGGSATGVNFVGTVAGTYSISGKVTDSNGNPLSGVLVSTGNVHSGAPYGTTAADGTYAITTGFSSGVLRGPALGAGTYTVTPSLNEYTFSPVSRSVTVNPTVGSQAGINFVGTVDTYTISGPPPLGPRTRRPPLTAPIPSSLASTTFTSATPLCPSWSRPFCSPAPIPLRRR